MKEFDLPFWVLATSFIKELALLDEDFDNESWRRIQYTNSWDYDKSEQSGSEIFDDGQRRKEIEIALKARQILEKLT